MSATIVSLPVTVGEVLNPAEPRATGPPGGFPAMLLPWPDTFLPAPQAPAADGDGGSDLPADGNALPPDATWLPLPFTLPPAVAASGEVPPAASAAAGPTPPAVPATVTVPNSPVPPAPMAAPEPAVAAIAASPPPVAPAAPPPQAAGPPDGFAPAAPTAAPQPAATTPAGTWIPPTAPPAPAQTVSPDPRPGLAVAARDAAAGRRQGAGLPQATATTAERTVDPLPNAAPRPVQVTVPGAGRTPPPDDPGVFPSGVAERPADLPLPAGGAAATTSTLAPPGPSAPQAATLQLPEAVGSERFGEQLSERVSWLVDRDLKAAQLKLNPPQLGPVEVRVQVNGDQASVSFTAHNFAARDALEQAMPRLREMLGAQGYVQVNVNVSQHSFSERPAQPAPYDARVPPPVDAAPPGTPREPAAHRAVTSLLDAYA